MKILNIGSLNIDYVYTVDHIVKEGETIASMQLESFCGGKGRINLSRFQGLVQKFIIWA